MTNDLRDFKLIAQRFDSLRWHDAKLVSLTFYRNLEADEEEVSISLVFPEKDGWQKPIRMTFKETTLINIQVDLEGKRVCSDSISTADCCHSSAWLDTLAKENPHDSFDGFLHFRIALIPPGGIIDILAKDFMFEPVVP